jgi:diaminopimelate decarboxylase
MEYFSYQQRGLCAEQVLLADIAKQYGTPCYVYSKAAFENHYLAYAQAFGSTEHLICYAVKANSNLAVLSVLAKLGSGFDIVSIGELERVLQAGGQPNKVVFSGVGKQTHEMRRALEVGVHCFNVESEAELHRLNEVALAMGKVAPVSLRVNPDVDAGTHPYISTGLKDNKFGVAIESAESIYKLADNMQSLNIIGVDCHIGSQLTEVQPFIDALDRVLLLVDRLSEIGIKLKHIDIGGGLGVRYQSEQPPAADEYLGKVLERLKGYELGIVIEPGRSIAANAGVLLTQVEFLKTHEDKHFAIVDAAMNDLLRPSLYGAWQDIIPLQPRKGEGQSFDIVGPVCETGDFLGKERKLVLEAGDLLAVCSAGAYGFAMSSNYNSRNRAAEILVDGDTTFLARRRETFEDQIAQEQVFPG